MKPVFIFNWLVFHVDNKSKLLDKRLYNELWPWLYMLCMLTRQNAEQTACIACRVVRQPMNADTEVRIESNHQSTYLLLVYCIERYLETKDNLQSSGYVCVCIVSQPIYLYFHSKVSSWTTFPRMGGRTRERMSERFNLSIIHSFLTRANWVCIFLFYLSSYL